jgi:tetratricopeptide (TPR) repeat protein
VYALAKSGDGAEAKSELAKLDAMSRPYPLLPALHAFVDRAPARASIDGGATAASVSRVDVSAPSTPPTSAGAGGGAGGSGTEPPGDSRSGMQAAGQAIRKGDWGRARQIYEGLVARNPHDSEALSGLGDVARAQGDPSGAIAAYKRALAVNPSYLPALLGVADTEWASGDRGGAQRAYKDIEDRFPEGTYPPYVKSRTQPAPTAPTSGASASGTQGSSVSASATAAPRAAPVDPDGL